MEQTTPTLHDHLNQHPDIANGDAIVDVWTIHDILAMVDSDDRPYPLSKRAARAILADIKKNSNAEYGITWTSIEDAISDYLRENPPKALIGHVAISANKEGRAGTWTTSAYKIPSHPFEDHTDTGNFLEDPAVQPIIAAEFAALAREWNPDALFVVTLDWTEDLDEHYQENN